MTDHDHARQMLALSRRDLRALEGMRNEDVFAYEIFGFHAQQTAEKALKAWISAQGASYDLTHDLGLLLKTLRSLGTDVAAFSEVTDLTTFAVHFRYDSAEEDSGFPERDEVIGRVAGLVAHVAQFLGED